jgi:TMEM175 potassium channel family protein
VVGFGAVGTAGDGLDGADDQALAKAGGEGVTNVTELTVTIQTPDSVLDDAVSQFLWHVRPELVSYGASFIVIASFWMAHRRIISSITRNDGWFAWINPIFLLLIACLPYPTAVVGRYPDAKSAVLYYDLLIVITGLWLCVLAVYSHTSNLVSDADRWAGSKLAKGTLPILISPMVFVISMVLTIWSLDLAKDVWIVAVIVYPIAWSRNA